MVRGDLIVKVTILSKVLKKVKELVMWLSGGGAFRLKEQPVQKLQSRGMPGMVKKH